MQAPNFFRFHPDGAQWSAGLGDYAYNDLGWKTAAIIGDDYSFPYTSLAGFVAEFCAIGGKVTKRIWPPLGEKDYSSYISQIPDDVDGIYVGIGGAGLISSSSSTRSRRAGSTPRRCMGNVFWDDPLVLKEVGKSLVGGATAGDDRGGLQRPGGQEVHRRPRRPPTARRSPALGPSVFTYGYYTGLAGADQGPRGRQWRRLGPEASSRRRWPDVTLSGDEAPWGDVKLDENRKAIADIFVKKIVKDANGDGVPDVQTFRRIPEVDQTFDGVFTRGHASAGPHQPEVRGRASPPPWVGNAEEVDFSSK